ncbi:MAG: hypothetical protein M9923_04280 [Phycicoccus sp.]|uniref:hypothetical protein n=1 Tax=Phycicoccus sp. TaxID=1902410 RepID=UPI00258DFF1B|nr:hypothetical protein [Phycicoccus sp.]MCO5302424.1 hypothetical protein [Phycicoccus sp.]
MRVRPLRPRRPRVPRGAVGALTIGLAIGLTVAPAGADPVFPSQGQVDAAKSAVASAAGSLSQIEGAYAAASRRLSDLRTEAGLAAAAEQAAQALLQERTAALADAETAAQQAAAEKSAADRELRHTAAQIYQEQGSMSGVGAYLASRGPQDLADRSAALAIVGDLRQQALSRATAGANRQAEARRVADLARTQQTSAAAAATSASRAASASARSAAQETALIAAEQDHRIAVLAAARQTSVEVERARQDGLAAEAAAAEAARKAAEEAAIQARLKGEAEAAAQAEAAAKAQADAAAKAEREAAAKRAADAAQAAKAAASAASQAPQPVTKPATPTTPATSAAPAATAPKPVATTPASGGGYSTTAYRQARLGTNANAIYSAVRTRFGITNIGGYRAGDWGDHGAGNAVDVMTKSFAEGDAVAAFAQANARQFNIKYIIWKQRIWFPGNGPDQWRWMADRGSITENHYDHVHISVNP